MNLKRQIDTITRRYADVHNTLLASEIDHSPKLLNNTKTHLKLFSPTNPGPGDHHIPN